MKAKIGITVLAVIFTLANSSCEYTGTRIDDEIIIKVEIAKGKICSTAPQKMLLI